jgi:membrane-bound metal-dependent hydrolase YbcI (DUF457 family)
MPFTTYHFGPALFFGLLLIGYLSLPTFLIGSVIIDVEPFLVLTFSLDYPLHGFFHSFLGSSIIAILLVYVMIMLNDRIQGIMEFLKIKQDLPTKSIWLASFSSIYLHVLFDAPLHSDIRPFYPLDFNPFYVGTSAGVWIYSVCAMMFLIGFFIYLYRRMAVRS